ncbi:MAG: hypothetical protein EOP41_03030 [Sphingobacteriaceae bacterium]|nr:MAG: hypothetical protein EOP41_03030 [Sphingobacteriaceae bacterium]
MAQIKADSMIQRKSILINLKQIKWRFRSGQACANFAVQQVRFAIIILKRISIFPVAHILYKG